MLVELCRIKRNGTEGSRNGIVDMRFWGSMDERLTWALDSYLSSRGFN
jgi:hypothetical protein